MEDKKNEDLSGVNLLSTIPEANSSTCGSVTATSDQPQTSSTLPLYNAIEDASSAEGNCNASTGPPHTLVKPSTASDNRAAALPSADHLAVWLHDQSDRREFRLKRSPTISFAGNGEIPVNITRIQLDPSSDEADLDDELSGEDKDEAKDSRPAEPTPQTSDDDTFIGAPQCTFLPFHRAQEEDLSRRGSQEDNTILSEV